MKILNGLDALPEEPLEPVLTLGSFDGVHRGHQALLGELREQAARVQAPSMVLTFFPHPREFFAPHEPFFPIMPVRERVHRLWDMELDYTLVLPFDADIAEMTAHEFVHEILWDALRVHSIYVGPYLSFGRDRRGDVRLLQSLGRALGFHVGVVDPIVIGQQRVSSTRIRQLIALGRLHDAATLLGRQHYLTGQVIPGDKRGRELGFPTANLTYEGAQLPPAGVYAAWVRLPDETRHAAVMNIGIRPTFDGASLSLEAHLLDWDGDLYGEDLTVSLVQQIRGEIAFEDAKQLRLQIRRDVRRARELLGVPRPAKGSLGAPTPPEQ